VIGAEVSTWFSRLMSTMPSSISGDIRQTHKRQPRGSKGTSFASGTLQERARARPLGNGPGRLGAPHGRRGYRFYEV
jgi:hypothetical protein